MASSMPQLLLPVDSSGWQCLSLLARPRLKYEKGQPREQQVRQTDANGEVVWEVQVVVMGDGQAEVIWVRVVGEPKVSQGELVRLEGLTASAWEMDDRDERGQPIKKYGVTFRATAIRPVAQRAAEKAAA